MELLALSKSVVMGDRSVATVMMVRRAACVLCVGFVRSFVRSFTVRSIVRDDHECAQ